MTETSSTAASLYPSVVVLPLRLESSEDGRARDLLRHDMSLAQFETDSFADATSAARRSPPLVHSPTRGRDVEETTRHGRRGNERG